MNFISKLWKSPARWASNFASISEGDLNRFWIRIAEEPAYVIGLMLVVSFICFSQFFIFGYSLYANSDLLLENYPKLIMAKHSFFSGSWGLWNANDYTGTPQAVNAVNPILYPENWALFFVPDRYLVSVYTFVTFLKFWFTGVAAFWFFSAELKDRRWGLFSALVYLLSGGLIWCLISSVALSIYFYYTLCLAFLWNKTSRQQIRNYLIFTLFLVMMLMPGNIAHAAYALLSMCFLYAYRIFSLREREPVFPKLLMFGAAVFTAMLIFSVHLLPILDVLNRGSRDNCPAPCKSGYVDYGILNARLFDTEIFGVAFYDSTAIFQSIAKIYSRDHLHVAMPTYFGIVALMLALWALASVKEREGYFWSVYVILILGTVTKIKPFDELALMLATKFTHVPSIQLILVVGVAAMAGLGGIALERDLNQGQIPRQTWQGFNALMIFGLSLVYVAGARIIQAIQKISVRQMQVTTALIPVLILGAVWIRWRRPRLFRGAIQAFLWTLVFTSLGLFVFDVTVNTTLSSHIKNLAVTLLLFALTGIFLQTRERPSSALRAKMVSFFLLAILILSAAVLLYPWTQALRMSLSRSENFVLACMGAVRFILAYYIFWLVVDFVRHRRLAVGTVFTAFILLLLAEQVPAFKVHTHINVNLFGTGPTPYPPLVNQVSPEGEPLEMNLKQYRVNYPNTMLQLPFYAEMFDAKNEICASINDAYDVRSYGGFNDTVPERNVTFLQNWVQDESIYDFHAPFCIYAKVKDDRFLNLTGVGYQYDPESGSVSVRPKAMSRVMLFTEFKNIDSDELALKELRSDSFEPLASLVLAGKPSFQSYPSPVNGSNLEFRQVNSDRIEADVDGKGPGLLFFGDSRDEGWSARVNDIPAEISSANYLFMAVSVPPGKSHIVFQYMPNAFKVGLQCAKVGFGIWLFVLLIFLIRRTSLFSVRQV